MLIKIDTWEIGCKRQGRKDGFLCTTLVCISRTEFEISRRQDEPKYSFILP